METKKIISNRIKALRKELGMTQQQLAESTGITLKSIRNYENCITEPNSKSMAGLERLFNVSGDYLRGETNTRKAEYIWEDQEIMEEVQSSITPMLKNILRLSQQDTLENKKSFFDILVELQAAVDIKDKEVRTLLLKALASDLHNTRSNIDKASKLDSTHNKI